MSDKKLNIYQKISEIRKSISGFNKDSKGFGFTYVSGSQVLESIKSKMDDLHVILIPSIEFVDDPTQYDYKNNRGEDKTDFIIKGSMKYSFVDCDNPSDKIEIPWPILGQQADVSQALGTAMTYAERYFLLKFFNVPTDADDPDAKKEKPQAATTKKQWLNKYPKGADKTNKNILPNYVHTVKYMGDNGLGVDAIKQQYNMVKEVEAELIKDLESYNSRQNG